MLVQVPEGRRLALLEDEWGGLDGLGGLVAHHLGVDSPRPPYHNPTAREACPNSLFLSPV